MDILKLLMGLAAQEQDPRPGGIEMLKRKMGGQAPWYMERTPPAWVPGNQQTQMFDAVNVSNQVPRNYGQ